MASRMDGLPYLGTGLGYRVELDEFLRIHPDLIDFVELMPEHVLEASPHEADRILRAAMAFPVLTHAVSMSIGSAAGPDETFLKGMADVTQRANAAWASDHLCFTRVGDKHLGQLMPLPYTDESLDVVIRNVRTAQRILNAPFALENVTRYFAYKNEDYTEPEFLTRIVEATGCYLLLDVTNVWNNARNLGIDDAKYLHSYPLDRVIHLHLGGIHEDDDGILDTHAGPVPEPVWAMTERVLAKAPVRALVIERDDEFGDLGQLAYELDRARTLMEAAR